jgi:RNA-binding protein 39
MLLNELMLLVLVHFGDTDELQRTGVDLGTTEHLQLLARLAEVNGLQNPFAAQVLQMSDSLAFGAVSERKMKFQDL